MTTLTPMSARHCNGVNVIATTMCTTTTTKQRHQRHDDMDVDVYVRRRQRDVFTTSSSSTSLLSYDDDAVATSHPCCHDDEDVVLMWSLWSTSLLPHRHRVDIVVATSLQCSRQPSSLIGDAVVFCCLSSWSKSVVLYEATQLRCPCPGVCISAYSLSRCLTMAIHV